MPHPLVIVFIGAILFSLVWVPVMLAPTRPVHRDAEDERAILAGEKLAGKTEPKWIP